MTSTTAIPAMPGAVTAKRQNFNITPEQEAELFALQSDFAAPTAKDTILKAVHLARVLAAEVKNGKRIGLIDRRSGLVTEIILPELEAAQDSGWTYLVPRPHAWKKQLFIKGRKQTAASLWLDMQTNRMSHAEAAENWDLPVAAIVEAEAYCVQNRALIQLEADEERLALQSAGVKLNP